MTIVPMLVGLYAAQSVTGSMVQTALPVVLRDAGMSLDRIGILSVLLLPWALKFLWAPLVDRSGAARAWILGCQLALVGCFLVAAAFPPDQRLDALIAVVVAMAFLAATQDIATDAAGVHLTSPGTRVLASGAGTVGGYAGFLIGAGLWLWVYARFGWVASMLVLAGCMAALTLPTLRIGRIETRAAAVRPRLRQVLANRRLVAGLGLLALWQGGVRLGSSMTGPMLVDAGLSLEAIAWLRGTGGMLVGLAAAVAGSFLVRALGVVRALPLAGAAVLVSALGLAAHVLLEWPAWALVALQLALAAGVAVSFVALYAAMMDWCAPAQVATDFAVLQSFDAVLAVACGIAAGQIAEHFGYAPVFLASALLIVLALPLVRGPLVAAPLSVSSARPEVSR